MPARRENEQIAVPVQEWEALNARLRAAESQLKTLHDVGMGAEPSSGGSQDEFLAMLAHELRNPLAPIRNAVEIMRLVGQKDTAIRTALDLISRQVDQLSRVVDDLLDVSEMNQGTIKLVRKPLDVNAVLWAAVKASEPLIDERHHSLTVVPLEHTAQVEGDFERLVQIVGNLLDNAAKYTAPGGEITLKAGLDHDSVMLSVEDNGMGIAPELLPDVFDLLRQPQASGDGGRAGLGIGLSVVRRLVSMHGGRVEARSTGPGHGSVFTVSLPLLRVAQAAHTPVRSEGGREMPRRIVVIDDNADAAESLAMLLRLKGHDVQIAYDGPSGLALALESAPDCVLIDIGLPGMDGYEVAKRLRSHDRDDRMLLIALTGYGQEEDRTRSRQAGFDHHLVKPVAQNVLEEVLREG